MVHVVGGSYLEVCREQRWDHLYGSGLRAAAALSLIAEGPELTTYIGPTEGSVLAAYGEAFGIDLHPSPSAQTLRFTYAHGLARPWIDPPLHLVSSEPALQVEHDVILRFGILEGDAVVHGNRVVYDPQSAYRPFPFHANGSTAGELAIVANQKEAEDLSGETDLEAMGTALLRDSSADLVLIKRGADGVRLFAQGNVWDVPAFRTARVFPIGSGDVFAAAFAQHWGTMKEDALTAATEASRATAYYCATRVLPIPETVSTSSEVGDPIHPKRGDQRRTVYLAGPFFTTAQRWLIEEARDALAKQGVRVFSPFHDVGIGPADQVANEDLQGLRSSHAVLAIGDGFDAGTLYEVGFARALGLPVVAFVQNEPDEPLKMLVGTGCEVLDDFVSAVYHAVWAAKEA